MAQLYAELQLNMMHKIPHFYRICMVRRRDERLLFNKVCGHSDSSLSRAYIMDEEMEKFEIALEYAGNSYVIRNFVGLLYNLMKEENHE